MSLNRVVAIGVMVASAWLAGVACGGSTDSGSAPVARDAFAGKFTDAVCGRLEPCCREQSYPFDREACAAVAGEGARSMVENAAVQYDAAAAGRCLQAISAAVASCDDLNMVAADCERVFTGTKGAGAACASSSECASPAGGSAYCSDDGSGQRACVVSPRGTRGAACNATCTEMAASTSCMSGGPIGGSGAGATPDTSCYTNDGLYCDSEGKCAPLRAAGESCDTTQESCVDGAWCAQGTCVARAAVGASCDGGMACERTAYCDDAGKCQAKRPNGAACSSDEACEGDRCDEGKCGSGSGIASRELCGGSSSSGAGQGGSAD
ncbi:MAG: hypothetical protein OZ921_07855 [Sorangiineae bacterium]|nr:hypothetical protein [Polyangiaceae bacterium]MEB2322411.1 hypothetical protein [Sorangiineae bacterium]